MSLFDGGRVSRRVLHPPLVHIPVGAIVVAAVLDVISSLGVATRVVGREMFMAATYALIVAVVGLFVAAVAGVVDRGRLTGGGSRARRAVTVHALAVAPAGPLAVVNIVVRSGRYGHASHTPMVPVALTLAALAVLVVGGALGGRLVYTLGLAVPARRGTQPARNTSRPSDTEGSASTAQPGAATVGEGQSR